MATFSLIERGWIPVRPLDGGAVKEVGLRELLLHADQFERIDDPSPLVTVALYRLVLAILHRALKGPNNVAQVAEWYRGGFPASDIESYLAQYADRFDLFHPEFPFIQVPDLTLDLEGGKYRSHWTRLGTEVGSANTTPLFNPAGRPNGERSDAITPAEAARRLLEHQTFALGGLIKRFTTSAKAAPVATLALSMPQGRTLQETLSLNLVPYDPQNDQAPWEAQPLKVAQFKAFYDGKEDRSLVPKGLVQHYAWLSRAVRLEPVSVENGEDVVGFIGFAAGVPYQNTLDTTGKTLDPMVATVPMRSDPKRTAPIAQKLRREQLFWRDVLALLPEPQNQPTVLDKNGKPVVATVKGDPPASLAHAVQVLKSQPLHETGGDFDFDDNDFLSEEVSFAQPVIPVSVYGQITDQGKAFAYRQEEYTLPHAFIENPQRFTDEIYTVLEDAKLAGNGLKQAVRRLATETLSRGGEREAHKDDVTELTQQLPAEETFWSRLEAPFRQYLASVDAGAAQARKVWRKNLVRTAWDAWNLACVGVGEGAAGLRAASMAKGILIAALSTLTLEETE